MRVSQCHGNVLCSAWASRNVVNQSQCSSVPPSTRCFHPALPLLAEGNVDVPSMGDSITEGSVASVEKKAGAYIDSFCVCCCIGSVRAFVQHPMMGHHGRVVLFEGPHCGLARISSQILLQNSLLGPFVSCSVLISMCCICRGCCDAR